MKSSENKKKQMKKDKEIIRLNKVIYFDEESVTDYVQIIAGGQLTQTTELLEHDANSGEGGVESGASIGIGKVFRSLIGLGASVSVDASLSTKFQNDNLVRNILQNTILTDFLSIANERCSADSKPTGIKLFEEYKIEVAQDSLSYIIMISPYMTMLKDSSVIKANSNLDFDISIDKIDEAIKAAKGYFEFIGNRKGEPHVVLRFNINAFKNNYKISDLLKMDLILYAIKVGNTTIDKMAITADINSTSITQKTTTAVIDNPEYGVVPSSNVDVNPELDVYDVLLAGIKEI